MGGQDVRGDILGEGGVIRRSQSFSTETPALVLLYDASRRNDEGALRSLMGRYADNFGKRNEKELFWASLEEVNEKRVANHKKSFKYIKKRKNDNNAQ